MEDKLHEFFSENNFDFHEPHSGHAERFQRKLNNPGKVNKTSWKWLNVAASVVLLVGFWLGANQKPRQLDLADLSPKMEETQNYFVTTIHHELKLLEKHRSLDTEVIIEDALEELEKLEDTYKSFVTEINENGYEKRIVYAMINNYQQRLEILNNVIQQIEEIKNTNTLQKDEAYI